MATDEDAASANRDRKFMLEGLMVGQICKMTEFADLWNVGNLRLVISICSNFISIEWFEWSCSYNII